MTSTMSQRFDFWKGLVFGSIDANSDDENLIWTRSARSTQYPPVCRSKHAKLPASREASIVACVFFWSVVTRGKDEFHHRRMKKTLEQNVFMTWKLARSSPDMQLLLKSFPYTFSQFRVHFQKTSLWDTVGVDIRSVASAEGTWGVRDRGEEGRGDMNGSNDLHEAAQCNYSTPAHGSTNELLPRPT